MSAANETAVPQVQPTASTAGEAEALDLAGVARFLNVSLTTAKAMRSDGRLPAPNLSFGRVLRWHKTELRIWCLSGCVGRALWSRLREQRLKQYLGSGAGLRSASA